MSKSAFSEGVGHFERKFEVGGNVALNLSMDRWIKEWCSYNSAAGSFYTINFVADFFRQKFDFAGKNSKIAFCATLWGYLGVTYTVHLRLFGKRVVDFLLVLIELCSPALTVEVLWSDVGRNCGFRKGVSHFERKFWGKGVVHQRLLASEN